MLNEYNTWTRNDPLFPPLSMQNGSTDLNDTVIQRKASNGVVTHSYAVSPPDPQVIKVGSTRHVKSQHRPERHQLKTEILLA